MNNEEIHKLDMKSKDIVEDNISKIAELFPECISEGKIDFDILKQELSKDIIDNGKEKYQLTWAGKNKSKIIANEPINKTLRPYVQESVEFEKTKNIFIEGDNLETLKILQESYVNKLDLIYIDPPYNTGKDFVYKDKYYRNEEKELEETGQTDAYSNRLVTNTETNGKYHSDWLTMIYPRIKLARNLLKPSGIIYISIDDAEVDNLRKICDEIFGENNFIAQIIVDGTPKNDPYIVSTAHEYCLVYVKNFDIAKNHNYGINNPIYAILQDIYNKGNGNFEEIQKKLRQYYIENNFNGDNISNYKYADKNGIYRIGPIDDPQRGGSHDERLNPKTGKMCLTPSAGWRCNIETWKEWIKNDLIAFPDDDSVLPSKKTYITEDRLDVMKAYFKIQTRKDTDYLKSLFGLNITPFSNPKPKELLKMFIKNCNNKELIGLDFFAGSGSFADAMMELNAEDNGNRKFILVQIPQVLDISNSQSGKEKKITQAAIDYLKRENLPTTIAEISKERIRKAGNYIYNNTKKDIDYGFRVYKVDSSNMKDVYYAPTDLQQSQLNMFESNIKEDRTAEDLLTQVILDLGLTLDLSIEERKIINNNVYFVENNSLVACFDDFIDINIIDEICKCNPLKIVFKESSFKNDSEKINAFERIKKISSETEVNIL